MNVLKTEMLRNLVMALSFTAGLLAMMTTGWAQAPASALPPTSEFHVDPQTGDLYRKTTRIVQRPIIEERIEREERTVYRPETIKETRPEYKTTYLPVTKDKWVPYMQGRWNLFRQPTVAYRKIPQTRWEARSEVVQRTTTKTRWIAEKRTIETPHQFVRYEPTTQTDVELVARALAPPRIGTGVDPAIAARLRPLGSSTSSYSVASGPTRPPTNTASHRSPTQSGMPTNVMLPGSTTSPLVPTTGVGVATVPPWTIYR